jgi:hypothetical protein
LLLGARQDAPFDNGEFAVIDRFELDERGRQLRLAVEQKFATLENTNSLQIFPNLNDITDFIKGHIPEESSFDDAEAILRAGGFEVEARPEGEVPGNRPGRYAVCGTMVIERRAMSLAECIVCMRPKSPGDYSVVKKISAVIKLIYP